MRKIFKFIQRGYIQILQSMLAFSLLGGVSAFAYLGFFTRYGADDYCFTRTLFKYDKLLDAAWWWYIHTSNRYTTMFLVGISEWFGRSAISYLPALAVVLWTVGLTWALSKICTILKFPRPLLIGFILAATSILFTIWEAPNRYQSLYWRAGLVTYLTPLIFLSYLAGLLLTEVVHPQQKKFGWLVMITLVMLGFFATGGLSETTLAMQIGALGLALCSVLLFVRSESRKPLLILLGVGLIASLSGLIAVFLSPANDFRREVFGEPPALQVIVLHSLRFAWDFMFQAVKSMPIPTLVTLLLSLSLGVTLQGSFNRAKPGYLWAYVPGIALLVAYLLIVCAMAPSVYGQGSYAGARSLFGAQFVLVSATITFGLFLGIGLRTLVSKYFPGRSLSTGLILLIAVLLILSVTYNVHITTQAISLSYGYQKRAAAWDARDQQIRKAIAQGETELTVEELDSIGGIREYSTQNKWVNRCAAEFYGLEKLLTYP